MARAGSNGIVWVAAAVLVTGMVVASWTAARDDDRTDVLRRFAAAQPALRGWGGGPRVVLHGDAHDGDAGVFYAAALAQWGRRGKAGAWGWLAAGQGPQTRAVAAEVVAPILGTLHLAAASARTDEITHAMHSRWVDLRELWRFAQRDAVARGDHDGLVAAWFGEMSVVADFGMRPGEREFAVWTADRVADLPAPAAAALAAGLARLETRVEANRSEPSRWLAQDVRRALQRATLGAPLRARLAAWRDGFDPVQQSLRSMEQLVAALPNLYPPAVDWLARQQQWQRYASAVQGLPGRAAAGWATDVRDHERDVRRALARIRLLRLAIAFAQREPLPELADPLGAGPFAVAIDGDVATFTSADAPQVLSLQAVRR